MKLNLYVCLCSLLIFSGALCKSFGENEQEQDGIKFSEIKEYFGEDKLEGFPWEVLFDGPATGAKSWRSGCLQEKVIINDGALSTESNQCGYTHKEAFGPGEFFIVARNAQLSISLWESEWGGYILDIKNGRIVLTAKRTGKGIPVFFNTAPAEETLYISAIGYRHLPPGEIKGKYCAPMRVRIKINGEVLCTLEDKWLDPGLVVLHEGSIEKMFFRGTSSFHKRDVDLPDAVRVLFAPNFLPLNRSSLPRGW